MGLERRMRSESQWGDGDGDGGGYGSGVGTGRGEAALYYAIGRGYGDGEADGWGGPEGRSGGGQADGSGGVVKMVEDVSEMLPSGNGSGDGLCIFGAGPAVEGYVQGPVGSESRAWPRLLDKLP